jgi:hypothetical protein
MAYLGRQPIIGNFQVLDAIVATTTDTYALTKDNGAVAVFPQTPSNCIVSLNGVIQAPVDSYTISGSDIVFASALTGSDSIDFITVLGDVLSIGTPTDGTVSLAKLSATGTKDATTFLRGDNTFQTIGVNTPAFNVSLSADQTLTNSAYTKIQFNTEQFDTNSAYDNTTNYRFTVPSGEDGKYFLYSNVIVQNLVDEKIMILGLYKNGSLIIANRTTLGTGNDTGVSVQVSLDLSVTDYIEVFVYQNGTGTIVGAGAATLQSSFGGYKLID